MIFAALTLWACSFAKDNANSKLAPLTRFVPPWNFVQLEVADNCAISCGSWNALYLSADYGCVGRDHAAYGDDKVSFCPDKTVIKTWTVDEELEYEAVYLISAELEPSELDDFNEITVEREMKLSVHPWHMLLQEEIDVPQDRRRVNSVSGSTSSYSCFGGNGGAWRQHEGSRPNWVGVRHGSLIDRLEFKFDGNGLMGGGGSGGGYSSTDFPGCIHYIYIRAGRYVDGIQFSSGSWVSPYYGGHGGGEYALYSPSGTCLRDIKMKTGRLVDQICFRFD